MHTSGCPVCGSDLHPHFSMQGEERVYQCMSAHILRQKPAPPANPHIKLDHWLARLKAGDTGAAYGR